MKCLPSAWGLGRLLSTVSVCLLSLPVWAAFPYPPSVPATSSTGSYTVSWSDTYGLQEQFNGGEWITVQKEGVGSSKTFSGKPGGTYGYRNFMIIEIPGYGARFSQVGQIVVTTPPAIPTGLTTPALDTDGTYTLSWNGSDGANSYTLQRQVNGGSWENVQTGSATSHNESGLGSANYGYRVRACSTTYGCSAYSGVKTTSVLHPPSTFTAPVGSSDGAVPMSWSAVSNATAYQLSRIDPYGYYDPYFNIWLPVSTLIHNGNGTRFTDNVPAEDKVYTYSLSACNGAGCSTAITKAVTVAYAPAVPSSLSVSPTTSYTGSHTASWSASSGAAQYQLEQKIGSDGWVNRYSGSSTSKTLSNLAIASYQYRARACRTYNSFLSCSNWRTSATATVSAPAVPALTAPAGDADGAYTISWSAATGATTYTLQRRANGGSWSTLQNTSVTSRSETGLGSGSYDYQVKACGGAGCSAYSAIKKTDVAITPGVPASLTVPGTNYSGSFTATWGTASGSVTYYTLQQKMGSGTYVTQYTGTSTSKTLSGLAANRYTHRVQACKTQGEFISCSGWRESSVTTVTTPAVPEGLSAPDYDTDGTYAVSWNGAAGATAYTLQRRANGGSWSTLQNGASTSKTESGLSEANYEYWVNACSGVGCSAYSPLTAVLVVYGPEIPPAFSAPKYDVNGTYTVSWGASPGTVSNYTLQEQVGGGAWTTIQDTAARYKQVSGKINNLYRYRVRACNAGKCSPYTAVKTVAVSNTPMTLGAINPPGDLSSSLEDKGTLAGEFSVGQEGAAQYAIPIQVPPGINGMAPKLSLTYHSGRGNGLLGWGWALQGLSTISRCPATRVQDNRVDGILHADSYKLCLDGQRLVQIGANEYRLENEAFIKITSAGNYGSSPGQFTVYRPNGEVLRYGHTSDSRRREPTRSDVYAWALNRIADPAGNYLEVGYTNTVATGDFRPAYIDYTFNDAAISLSHRVAFVYESRPDVTETYVAGALQTHAHRLSRVEVRTGGQLVRQYRLGYEVSDGVSYADPVQTSRLNRIQLCFASSTDCMAPIEVEWSSTGQETFTIKQESHLISSATLRSIFFHYDYADMDGDGLMDLITRPGEYTGTDPIEVRFGAEFLTLETDLDAYFEQLLARPSVTAAIPQTVKVTHTQKNDGLDYTQTTTTQPGIGVIDINGDGRSDLVLTDNYHKRGLKIYLSQGRTFTLSSAYSIPESALSYTGSRRFSNGTTVTGPWSDRVEYQDVNGDGLIDLVRYSLYSDMAIGDRSDVSVALNTGTGFEAFQTWFTASQQWRKWVAFADVNGDRLPDLIGYTGEVALNTGSQFALHAEWGALNGLHTDEMSNSVVGLARPQVGDVNGDGLEDLVGFYTTGIKVYLSTGHGFKAPEVWSSFIVHHGVMRVVDANADGKADVLFAGWTYADAPGSDRQIFLLLSTGHSPSTQPGGGFAPEVVMTQAQDPDIELLGIYTSPKPFFDFNQDGVIDWYNVSQIKRHQVLAIREGEARSIDIQYRPLAQYGLHDTATGGDSSPSSFANQRILQSSGNEEQPEGSFSAITRRSLAGRFAVAETRVSNGVGGQIVRRYHYGGARYHREGWGDLGFQTVDQETSSEGGVIERVQSEYSQAAASHYTLAGRLLKQTTEVSNAYNLLSKVSETVNYWKVKTYSDDIDSDFASPHFFPYLDSSTTDTHDLNGADRHRETRYSLDYDAPAPTGCKAEGQTPSVSLGDAAAFTPYGGLEQSAQVRCDSSGHYLSTTRRTYQQLTSGGQWVLNRVITENVTRTTPTDSDERESSFTYNALGQLAQAVIEPNHDTLRLTTDYTYNDFGSVEWVTESWPNTANGMNGLTSRTTAITETFASNGERTVTTVNPLNHSVTEIFEGTFGQLKTRTDANGAVTAYTYDTLGRALSETLSAPGQPTLSTQTRYRACESIGYCSGESVANAATFVYQKTDGQAPVRVFYDAFGREVGSRVLGFEGTPIYRYTDYDALGRVYRVSEPTNGGTLNWTTNTYDHLNRVIATTYPDSSTSSIDYNGLEVIYTNALNQTHTEYHNALGQVVQTRDALNTPVDYTYDAFGNLLTTQVDSNPATLTTITYDAVGHKVGLSDPDTGYRQFKVNALGLVYQEIDAKNQVTQLAFDVLGRMTARREHGSGSVNQWVYDTAAYGKGRLASVNGVDTQGRGYTETYQYNGAGQPTRVVTTIAGTSYTTDYRYDSYRRLAGTVYPVGTESFTTLHRYNSAGFLDAIYNAYAGVKLWEGTAADARGQLTETALESGVIAISKTFEPNTGRLTGIESTHVLGISLQDQRFAFDALGNLTRRTDTVHNTTENFCYDDLNRLTHQAVNSGCVAGSGNHFSYDRLGNLTYKQGVGSYSYGADHAGPHAVTNAGGQTYQYDNNGDMTSGNGRTITYSAFGKPTVMSRGSNQVSIVYGPDRNRIERGDTTSAGTTTTTYVQGLFEKVVGPSKTQYRYYVGEVAIHMQTAMSTGQTSSTAYPLRDSLGSVVVQVDEEGLVIEELANNAWGERLQGAQGSAPVADGFEPLVSPRGFTDHEHLDGVGLIHMGGRVYDPRLGRFLSADPFVQAPLNSQSFNRYSYVWNNPLSLTDPTGFKVSFACAHAPNCTVIEIGGATMRDGMPTEFGFDLYRDQVNYPNVSFSVMSENDLAGMFDMGVGNGLFAAHSVMAAQRNGNPFDSSIQGQQVAAVDTVADGGFILYDAGSLVYNTATGNWVAAGTDAAALAADVVCTFVPVATGCGAAVRAARAKAGVKALPKAKVMDHHLFPQQFKKYFKERGIDIDLHTVTLGEKTHLKGVHGNGLGKMPGGWNKQWQSFIENNPNATPKEVYQQLGRMMDEFGLNTSRIHPYLK